MRKEIINLIINNMEKIKTCSKCKKAKLITEFHKSSERKDSLYPSCKSCVNKIKSIFYKKNQKTLLKNAKEYYKKNKTNILKRVKKYNSNIPKGKKRFKHKQWVNNNNEHVKEYARKWHKNKSLNDIQYRLNRNIRNGIWRKMKGLDKASIKNLPYTIEELKIHLEKQFKPWMNWNNYGKGKGTWSIDHIIPMSTFHYKSVEDKEFQECWALKNLQPLESIENIKKSNKHDIT